VAFGTGTLYRAGPDQTLDVWALRDGRLRQTPGADPAAVTGLAWSADGSRLRALTRWPGGRCRLEAFDADTGLPAGPATEGVWHVEELHAGSGVLFACGSAALRWRDAPEKATRLRAFDDSSREIPAPAWNAAAAGLTAASAGQALAILDARGNLPVWAELAGNPNRFQPPGVLAAALSADGRRLLTAGAERIRAANWNGRELRWPDGTGVLSVWDVATDGRLPRLTERRRPTSVTSPVLCVAMAPDGSAGASGERDGLVRLWDLETGQERSQFSVRHEGGVAALAYSADGRLLASGGHDGRLVIASADSLRAIKEWQLPGPPIALRFDPSGRRLAVANGNGTAWVLAVP
jgi:WD40 repeat protein